MTTPVGRPPLVTVTMLPASASWARRTASPSGRSSGTVRVRRARSRATRPGSRRRSRAEAMAEVAPDQRNRAMTKARTKSRTSGGCAEHALLDDRPAQDGDRGEPTAPARDDGAAVHVAGRAPHRRLEDPSAVEGQSGDEVEDPDQQVGAGQSLHRHPEQAVRGDEPEADRARADRDRGQRTDDRDHELLTRLVRLALDGGHAAEEVEGDRADREAVPPGHHRVGRLVQQHREVEHDREGQPGDVLPRAEAGLDLRRPAAPPGPRPGPRPGTRTSETSTSLPAIEPIRIVPGASAHWLVGHVATVSDTITRIRPRAVGVLSVASPRVGT